MKTGISEKRRHTRINTKNMVSYILYNEKGKKIDKGKGFTRNLSQSGVLLQTDRPLPGVFIVLMTIDLEGNIVTVKGKVAHSRSNSTPGDYLSGINFLGPEDKQREAIIAFVKVYQRNKNKYLNNKK